MNEPGRGAAHRARRTEREGQCCQPIHTLLRPRAARHHARAGIRQSSESPWRRGEAHLEVLGAQAAGLIGWRLGCGSTTCILAGRLWPVTGCPPNAARITLPLYARWGAANSIGIHPCLARRWQWGTSCPPPPPSPLLSLKSLSTRGTENWGSWEAQ